MPSIRQHDGSRLRREDLVRLNRGNVDSAAVLHPKLHPARGLQDGADHPVHFSSRVNPEADVVADFRYRIQIGPVRYRTRERYPQG
jgi:hypothetical protein